MSTTYVTPKGAGKKDGSSWDNAATIDALSMMIDKAGDGGAVLLRADMGAYQITKPVMIRAGGSADAKVTIKGVDGAGRDMKAEFVGTRAAEWNPAAADGGDAFRLLGGADHLVFENLAFKNTLNAFRVGADIKDLTIEDVTADNVQRFFENYVSGSATTATISGLVIRDVDVTGFSRGAVRLQYDTHDVLIERVRGDSERIDGDNFAMGVHLHGTVHDVVLRKVVMENTHDTTSSYWNGDGFATERGVSNVRFEDTVARGNTDGGYDLKSSNTVLIRAVAEDNKRNFRIWADDTIIVDSASIEPNKRGGIGGESHFWVGKNAKVVVVDSKVVSKEPTTIYNLEESGAQLLYKNISMDVGDSTRLKTMSGSSSVSEYTGSIADELDLGGGGGVTGDTVKQPPVLSVSAQNATVAEGQDLVFVVERTGDLSGATEVSYVVNGAGPAAASAADFDGALSGKVTFPAGQSQQTIRVATRNDTAVEADETVQVTLSDPSGATLRTAAATATLTSDDVAPVSKAFSFDIAAKTGAARIALDKNDVVVTTRALPDGNKDGLIQAGVVESGRDGRFHLDGTKTGDTVTIAGVKTLRHLGADKDGHLYADASVRVVGSKESKLGADSLAGDVGDRKADMFFFDTALGRDLGPDTLLRFGDKDRIVTTTALDGLVSNGGVFELDGGGSVKVTNLKGSPVGQLEFDGMTSRGGVDYYVYSLPGSSADHLSLFG